MPSWNHTTRSKSQKAPFIIRMAVWTIPVLLFLMLSGIISLHLPPVQREIIRRVVTRIEALTNLKVQIRSFQWFPFSGMSLTSVKIESEGKPILDCGRIRLGYSLSLQPPYIIVEQVYLEKPFLQVERSTDGKWTAPVPLTARLDGPAEPLWNGIRPPHVQIAAGTVEAVQHGNTVFSIRDISCAVRFKRLNGREIKGTTGTEGNEVQLEYRVNRAVSVRTQAGGEQSGVDIFRRHDFGK